MVGQTRGWLRRLAEPGRDRGRLLLINGATAIAYFLAAGAGALFLLPGAQGSFVWPASGIAVALIFLLGDRALPGLALGALAWNLVRDYGLPAGVGITAASVAEAWIGAIVLRRARITPDLSRLDDVFTLALPAAAMAALAAGIGAPVILMLGGKVASADLLPTMLAWWLGDALGVLVFTPLVLALSLIHI